MSCILARLDFSSIYCPKKETKGEGGRQFSFSQVGIFNLEICVGRFVLLQAYIKKQINNLYVDEDHADE